MTPIPEPDYIKMGLDVCLKMRQEGLTAQDIDAELIITEALKSCYEL